MVGYFICIMICVALLSAFPFMVDVYTFATLVVAMLINFDVVFLACGCVAIFIVCVLCGCFCGCVFGCVCGCICGCGCVCVPPPDSEANVEELSKEETTEKMGVENRFGQAKELCQTPSESAHN